jgi:hypothetical protein
MRYLLSSGIESTNVTPYLPAMLCGEAPDFSSMIEVTTDCHPIARGATCSVKAMIRVMRDFLKKE